MQVNPEIFKAYDIRGIYGQDLTDKTAEAIGNVFAQMAENQEIIVGCDMRLSREVIFSNLIKGINKAGVNVIDIGLVSTDVTYFAAGFWKMPAIMITASHNPREWNGFKLTLADAIPFGQEEIQKLKNLIEQDKFINVLSPGIIKQKDILSDYLKNCLKFINIKNISNFKIVVDAGNAMAGKLIPLIFNNLPCQIIPLYFELDGSFPNHQPSPIESKNLLDLQKGVLKEKANFGMAFDGDADRVFFIDEQGKAINGGVIVAILTKYFLKNCPNEKIIYDLRCSHSVPEIIQENNGQAIISRVGHSFIKKTMEETGAIFGGEFSGHYYYRDNYRADSGMITALIITEIISQENKPLSVIAKEYTRYWQIEETNSIVKNQEEKIEELKEKYFDGHQSELDGLTVKYFDWWFNVRASNTEPVLRLNLEAVSQELMEEKKDELLKLINA